LSTSSASSIGTSSGSIGAPVQTPATASSVNGDPSIDARYSNCRAASDNVSTLHAIVSASVR
jgi:hypothetical protein